MDEQQTLCAEQDSSTCTGKLRTTYALRTVCDDLHVCSIHIARTRLGIHRLLALPCACFALCCVCLWCVCARVCASWHCLPAQASCIAQPFTCACIFAPVLILLAAGLAAACTRLFASHISCIVSLHVVPIVCAVGVVLCFLWCVFLLVRVFLASSIASLPSSRVVVFLHTPRVALVVRSIVLSSWSHGIWLCPRLC